MTTARDPGPTGAGTRPLRVLLAIADFPLLATAFRAVIEQEPDMAVMEAPSHEAVADAAMAASPDVILLECAGAGGPACGSYDTIRVLREACPDARIIALDCRCATEQFSVALKAGADGFLTREAQDNDVVAAIRSVAAGHAYVSPAIVTRMVDTYVRRGADAGPADPYESLTDREREVLLLAALGHTNREIARSLRLSEQAVHYNRANVMEKLGLHDRVELLRYSVRRGLLDPSAL